MNKMIDLACLGRVAVDLYGNQINTPLDETLSFSRYLGGSSGNIAVSAARGGLKVAIISTVGNDQMGNYLINVLKREGINTRGLRRDPSRRTAMAFLGMLDSEVGGLEFYRENAADVAISEANIPSNYFEDVNTLVLTGTHVADPEAWRGIKPIFYSAKAADCNIVLDLDLRHDLWINFDGGIKAAKMRLEQILKDCTMIVGNGDEFELFAQNGQPLEALRVVTDAILVQKLGSEGAAWYECKSKKPVARVKGIPISVVNPVGAGDAFLGNLLAQWQRGADAKNALEAANAAGALVATRHGCSAEMPYPEELRVFIKEKDQHGTKLNYLKRSLSRRRINKRILALACDHRRPFEQIAGKYGKTQESVCRFKNLVYQAMCIGTQEMNGVLPGMLMDSKYGQEVLNVLGNTDTWTGRPIEVTGSRPLECEAGFELGSYLAGWRPGQVAKVLTWYHPDDDYSLKRKQITTLHYLQAAARSAKVEWMLELVPPLEMERSDLTIIRSVEQCYDADLMPDWWKLPALNSASSWDALNALLTNRDSCNRGVMVLGLNEPLEELEKRLALAAQADCCAGFAIGRTIFGQACEKWFADEFSDQEAIDDMGNRYSQLAAPFLTVR